MNFKTIKEFKVSYPRKIEFKPLAISLGVGLSLSFSGCAGNQPNTTNKTTESKTVDKNESSIGIPPEPVTGGVPLPPEPPKK